MVTVEVPINSLEDKFQGTHQSTLKIENETMREGINDIGKGCRCLNMD